MVCASYPIVNLPAKCGDAVAEVERLVHGAGKLVTGVAWLEAVVNGAVTVAEFAPEVMLGVEREAAPDEAGSSGSRRGRTAAWTARWTASSTYRWSSLGDG